MSKPKVYVGCSLTNAPQEFKEQIAKFRNILKEDFEILEFLSDPLKIAEQSTGLELCQQIYEYDRNCVLTCDLMIAEVSYPSLGEGMELAFAAQNKKPIIAIANHNANVSRMILGINDTHFEIIRYEDIFETIPEIRQKIKEIFSQ